MAEQKQVDLNAVASFLQRHNMGVDDFFFILHLGAKQLIHKPDMPAPLREHWTRVAEECYHLWHNTLRDGKPVE
jgi:hypothetical protein